MSFMVPLALFGWPLVVMALFGTWGPRRAVLASFIGAWLFLPVAGYPISGLPNYDKTFAACVGTFLGIIVFDSNRLLSFRSSVWDLPMAVWCLCPMGSCVANGLGLYAGASAVVNHTITWGLPYLAGRLYFRTADELRELAIGLFIGGLAYVPFCLYEIRMSPQLHSIVYGFYPHSFAQSKRGGGWRPSVFMQHGLAVAMWMSLCAMLGIWLWRSRLLTRVGRLPIAWPALGLAVTAVLCKSLGALQLLIMGLTVLLGMRRMRRSVLIACLAVLPVLYMGVRTGGLWSGVSLVSLQAQLADEDRASSLETRLNNEDRIIGRVWHSPLLGYGWADFMLAETGDKDVTPDGMWTLVLGQNGFLGLAALTLVFLLPVLVLWNGCPAAWWWEPATAPVAGLAVLACLYVADNLFNAMVNPVFNLVAGGLTGLVADQTQLLASVGRKPVVPAATDVAQLPLVIRRQGGVLP